MNWDPWVLQTTNERVSRSLLDTARGILQSGDVPKMPARGKLSSTLTRLLHSSRLE